MGWFGSPAYKPHEQGMLEQCTNIVATWAPSVGEARRMVKETLDTVIKESKRKGVYDLPLNMGEIILGHASANTEMAQRVAEVQKSLLPAKRVEGVTDADIRSWWNMYDVERRMAVQMDENDRMGTYLTLVRQAVADDGSAFVKLWQIYPRFGNPDDTSQAKGDDRPLPLELKTRINRYVEHRVATDLANWQVEMTSATSLNALVRQRICEGTL
jgi:hypothetical protein